MAVANGVTGTEVGPCAWRFSTDSGEVLYFQEIADEMGLLPETPYTLQYDPVDPPQPCPNDGNLYNARLIRVIEEVGDTASEIFQGLANILQAAADQARAEAGKRNREFK